MKRNELMNILNDLSAGYVNVSYYAQTNQRMDGCTSSGDFRFNDQDGGLNTGSFNGTLDDFLFYDSAQTEEQVMDVYTGQTSSNSTITLSYDDNGNMVYDGQFFREYNGLNQLARIYNGSSAAEPLLQEYTYSPVEERVAIKKTYFPNGTIKETVYYFNDNYVSVVNSTGTYNYSYVYLDGQLVAQVNPDGSKYYIHGNHEGSATKVTNSSGAVIESTTYAPFGEVLSGGAKTRYGYESREHDTVVGDTDFRARRYQPEYGIFLQPDPIISDVYNPQNLNRYAFELNNPYKYTDPDGSIPIPIITGSIGGIIGWGVGAGVSAYTQHRDTGHIDYQVVGKASLVGATSGFIAGATFGLATPMLGEAANSGGAVKAAPLVGIAGGISSVAGGQAAVATENALSGDSITSGLGNSQQMGGDFLLGTGSSMITYGTSVQMSKARMGC
jgi:RHS repeat-associated protein